MPKQIAVSACLLGEKCRYDGSDNKNTQLLKWLEGEILIPFCPEAYAFGTPRPTMDLIRTAMGNKAVSNETGEDLSAPVIEYANAFFDKYPEIELFVGKDRSPSCGVCSAKVYDEQKHLLSDSEAGLMANIAMKRNIPAIDAEKIKDEDEGF